MQFPTRDISSHIDFDFFLLRVWSNLLCQLICSTHIQVVFQTSSYWVVLHKHNNKSVKAVLLIRSPFSWVLSQCFNLHGLSVNVNSTRTKLRLTKIYLLTVPRCCLPLRVCVGRRQVSRPSLLYNKSPPLVVHVHHFHGLLTMISRSLLPQVCLWKPSWRKCFPMSLSWSSCAAMSCVLLMGIPFTPLWNLF